ncbi:glutathione S-transferase [Actibacterium mucosum KCTC 23349]|uniref:Glutathione S-transferase n=1 Tax=Actibacterium mucosum KCTC 23349 TaxID=1454373 RepID=A0A037ZP81_9RHOB|nr:glutathione S-transferase family protein [Actibacterium mucosum]KAJ57460.1 glutathione S-transferase [Actibacterium mucosum KCTC 23349]
MYQVYGTILTRTFRVLWVLEEIGQPYELIAVRPQSPEIRAQNPSGKVPAMVADGVTLTDSVAIMTYLADKHGALTYPAGSIERGRQDALTHQILDEMDAVLWTASRHSFILPEDLRTPEVKDSLKWEFSRALQRMTDRLGDGPYLMGETMTIADILLAHCLRWSAGARFPQDQQALLAYRDRMYARPAAVKLLAQAAA